MAVARSQEVSGIVDPDDGVIGFSSVRARSVIEVGSVAVSGGSRRHVPRRPRRPANRLRGRRTFGDSESGPDPHFHRSISEQFYVLTGQVRLYDGHQWVTARCGDFLYVPEGGIHGFRGADQASMLLMFAPGGPREDYFETLARGEQMTQEQRADFMQRLDTYWV